MKSQNYNSIDLLKFIMAICVVAIHTQPLVNCTNEFLVRIYDGIINCAVPFFFLASGFLLAIKLEWPFDSQKSICIIKKYIIKILKLYLIWTVIYLPLALCEYIHMNTSIIHIIYLYIKGFVFVGEHYNSWILWYLLSTIYALLFILILLKRHISPNAILICGFILLLTGMGCDALVQCKDALPKVLDLLKKVISFSITNGRILRGAFYIPCGMVLANRKIPRWLSIIALFVCFPAKCLINHAYIKEALLSVCAIALFALIVDIKLKDSRVFPGLRKMSTWMYFIHLYVWTFYYTLVYGEKMFGIDSFIVTVFICSLLSYIYILNYHDLKMRNNR